MTSPILQPVVALVLWSFVMWAWLYATRIPALRAARFELKPDRTKDEMNAVLPSTPWPWCWPWPARAAA
jgi:hypothetical protein